MVRAMDKLFFAMCCVFLLTGCKVTDKLNIAKAEAMCENEGGLYSVDVYTYFEVKCNNGAILKIQGDKYREYNSPSVIKFLKGEANE